MLKVDEQVFKLKDPRINALSHGRLTVQALAYTIKPGDWIILYKDTIYALSQDEYYAAQQMQAQNQLTKEVFQTVLKQDLNKFDAQDKAAVQRIKKSKSNCSACQYNAYKTQLLRIMQKYPWMLSKYKLVKTKKEILKYPETTEQILPKVYKLFDRFFQKTNYQRKPCLDCVQKHVGMAYIKGCQSQQGYPEHLVLAVANLEQAYEQCPTDCTALRETLMFCIGKTKKDDKLFLPLDNILYLINISKQETKIEAALDQNQADDSFDLEMDESMITQISNIPVLKKVQILKEVRDLISLQYSGKQHISVKFQGYLGSIADMILPFSVKTSNMLRNRRLMFKACPQLVRQTQYDCKDLQDALRNQKATTTISPK